MTCTLPYAPNMASAPRSPGRSAFLMTVAAFVWSVGLVVAALLLPAYGSATLVEENGTRVFLPVAAPAVISIVVWLALWRKCSRGGRVTVWVAWTFVALLVGVCVVTIPSIGISVTPVAVLLACAASRTPSGSPPARGLA